MVIDPRSIRELHKPLYIDETQVETIKKSQQRQYFLRRLRKFGMPAKILSNFYRCTNESVLTFW